MKNRIKQIRKNNKLSMEEFAKKIGITRSSISRIESGENTPSEQTLKFICKEFYINEEWLRTGNGEMRYIAEDETAAIVSDLLEKENPLYDIILGILKTYQNLDKDSQNILDNFALELQKEIKGED